jgi:hypothetical protein
MMWRRLILTLAFLCMLTPGSALSADQHVLGTIMAVDKTHVEIKTTKGPSVIVRVDKNTRYKDESSPKGMNMPEVGDRVVVKATKEEKEKVLLAINIHFSSARRAPAPIRQTLIQPAPVQPEPAQQLDPTP